METDVKLGSTAKNKNRISKLKRRVLYEKQFGSEFSRPTLRKSLPGQKCNTYAMETNESADKNGTNVRRWMGVRTSKLPCANNRIFSTDYRTTENRRRAGTTVRTRVTSTIHGHFFGAGGGSFCTNDAGRFIYKRDRVRNY